MGVLLAVLILAVILGGAGFAYSILWPIAGIILVLWFLGFLLRSTDRRWYYW